MVKLVLELARAIVGLHENGVLDRDANPDNVLVFTLDEALTDTRKLTDLVVAERRHADDQHDVHNGVRTPTIVPPRVFNRKSKKAAIISALQCFALINCTVAFWFACASASMFPCRWA